MDKEFEKNRSQAKILYAAFKVLKEAGGYLPSSQVIEIIRKSVELTDLEKSINYFGICVWENDLKENIFKAKMKHCLQEHNDVWYLTRSGVNLIKIGPDELLKSVRKSIDFANNEEFEYFGSKSLPVNTKPLYSVKNINIFYDNFNNSDKYPYLVIPDDLLNVEYSSPFNRDDYDYRMLKLKIPKDTNSVLEFGHFVSIINTKPWEPSFPFFSTDEEMKKYNIKLQEYNKRLEEHKKKTEEKERAMEGLLKKIEVAKEIHESKQSDIVLFELENKHNNEKFNSDKNINVNYLNKFVKNNIYPTKVNKPIKKGTVEALFVNYLKSKLSNLVDFIVDYELKTDNSDYENNYIPDIIIKTKSGILIDVEIDEPYTLDTGQPIHYIDADSQRDEFFKLNNYCVIRFAEEQVLYHPSECAYFIIELLECLDSKYWQDRETEDVSFNIPVCNKWSMNEARKLQIENYREEYLNDKEWLKRYAELDIEEYSSGALNSILEYYDSDYKFLFYNEYSIEREVNRAKVNKLNNEAIEGPSDDLPF
jgi:hypothetical protein